MNAKEIIARYNAGERDFRRLNLRGLNFEGANLSGADFSECNIHGTNFRRTNLQNTRFTKAEGGLTKTWCIILFCCATPLTVILDGFGTFAGAYMVTFVEAGAYLINGYVFTEAFSSQLAVSFIGACIYLFIVTLAWTKNLITTIITAVALLGISITLGLIFEGLLGGVSAVAVFGFSVIRLIITTGLLAVSGYPMVLGNLGISFILISFFSISVINEGEQILDVLAFWIGALPGLFFWLLMSWRIWYGQSHDKWVRAIAVEYGSINGTNFECANLTETDFTGARLKSTDFRDAILVRTIFKDTIKLDQVRPGKSYLAIKKVRDLLLSGKPDSEDKNYSRLVNLQGLNLAGFNLTGANFSGSNLSDSNLSGANLSDANLITTNLNNSDLKDSDLSRVKLVQTQLDKADLTGATLTGACIEDWGITVNTMLNGIHADYVYMRFLDGDKRRRKPDGEDVNFAEGEFVEFIKPLVDTLDLYHVKARDPRIVSIALNEFQENNPNLNFDIISVERRGKQLEDLLLRLKIWGKEDVSALHSQYFDIYQTLASLPFEKVNKEISQLFRKVMESAEQSVTNNFYDTENVNQFFNTQTAIMGDQILEQKLIQGDDNSVNTNNNYDMSSSNFGVGVNQGEIAGDATIAGQYNAAQKQNLAEAATEIRELLTRLESEYGNQTTMEKMTVAQEVIREINKNPTFAQRLYSAIKAGGVAALDSWLDRPEASFVIEAIKDWYETAPNS